LAAYLKRHWPLIITIASLYAVLIACLVSAVKVTGGNLIYVLDDTYIHMAMAKNISEHGIWGITGHGFTSSSSSPLWTSLIALSYFLFGPNTVTPLVLNVLLATIFIIWLYNFLGKLSISRVYIFLILISVTMLTSLPSLVFSGLEHVLHTFICFIFICISARSLSELEERPGGYLLLLIAPLMVLVRYEALFLIFTVCCLFFLRKNLRMALILGVTGLCPVILYGVYSLSQGWFILPNSVLLKGNIPILSAYGVFRLIVYGYYKIAITPHILILVLAVSAMLYRKLSSRESVWGFTPLLQIIYLSTTLLHLQFARIENFFRYESYLVALGLFVIGISLTDYSIERQKNPAKRDVTIRRLVAALLVIAAGSPLVVRGARSVALIPQASKNIHEQQYQMALFLKEFYPDQTIAANDIGAINYFAEIDCLDLYGIGSLEVAKAKRELKFSSGWIESFAGKKQVRIAILYKKWYDRYGGLPSSWIEVAQWRIADNVACGDNTVCFYAVAPGEAEILSERLRKFSPRLPEGVLESGRYQEIIP
jgi:hypothetical protein